MWYGLVQPGTGDLVSVGTEAMFPDENINAFSGVYDRVDFGETRPNFAMQMWNPTTRLMVDRPAPLLISRLDDIETWLLADPDWLAVWQSLSQARKTQIRTGFRRVLNRLLGNQQWRGESDGVEL
jgi:hypothetical protein